MTTAADAVRAFITPLLASWLEPGDDVQFSCWVDKGGARRYAVLRPVGGPRASLVREPAFTLLLVAKAGDPATAAYAAAQPIIAAARTHRDGTLVSVQAADPVCSATSDGRPMAEIAITTATD